MSKSTLLLQERNVDVAAQFALQILLQCWRRKSPLVVIAVQGGRDPDSFYYQGIQTYSKCLQYLYVSSLVISSLICQMETDSEMSIRRRLRPRREELHPVFISAADAASKSQNQSCERLREPRAQPESLSTAEKARTRLCFGVGPLLLGWPGQPGSAGRGKVSLECPLMSDRGKRDGRCRSCGHMRQRRGANPTGRWDAARWSQEPTRTEETGSTELQSPEGCCGDLLAGSPFFLRDGTCTSFAGTQVFLFHPCQSLPWPGKASSSWPTLASSKKINTEVYKGSFKHLQVSISASPSLEVPSTMDGSLGSLIWWRATRPWQSLELDEPFQPKGHSIAL